METMHKQVQL